MPKKEFTEKQLNNWKRYEKVRQGARWNMYSREAREATGLNEKEYLFCMEHFTELKNAVEAQNATSN